MRELAIIKTRTTGQCFGTVGLVIVKGKLVHTTDVRPFGFDSSANSDAEEWAERNGYETIRGREAMAAAQAEYSRTVAVAMISSMPADGRRVLTSEHVSLAAAIQAFGREGQSEPLEHSTDECGRVRKMWT